MGLEQFLLMLTPSRNQRLGDSRQYNTKCVCQICTCGRHHCPRSTTSRFEGETTNHHDYRPYQIEPSHKEKCTHQYKQRHYDPEALKTSYDKFYHPYEVEKRGGNYGNKYQYKPKSGNFYGETQYNTSYKNKEVPREPIKDCNHKYVPRNTKFQGSTTYKTEYNPKEVQPKRPSTSYNYERRKVPFEGKTIYNTQYQPHQLEKNQPRDKCQHTYNPRNSKFQGESHYKHDYKAHEIQIDPRCPILDLPKYPRECSPGKHHVNYMAEKDNWN